MGKTGRFYVDEDERKLFGGHADGSGEMDDDEDEEDGQDEYEKDGFVVDDAEEDEEEGGDDDEERQKKKKRKKKEEYLLDEDDYELLEDNNIKIPRQKGDKRFKRLKKARKGLKEESYGYFKEEFVGSSTGFRTAEEKIKQTLFGDDEGSQLEDIGEEDEEPEEELDVGDEDEMADFIVDEEEVDEHGALRRKLKKKRSRYAPEVSSFALQEAHDIFGDVDELLELRKEGMSTGKYREQRIEDGFEPIVVSEKYMTERDEQIRKLDIPERMQLLEETIGPLAVDKISIEAESSWIYSQLESGAIPFFGSPGCQELSINREDIIRFLNLVHLQRLDIPFIAMYRKEEIPSLLKDPEQSDSYENQNGIEKAPSLKWHKVLWVIQYLDKKWLLLQKRKTALQSYYDKRYEKESRLIYDETRLSSNQHLLESVMMTLKLANSEREVDDVDSKFNLHFPPDEEQVDGGQFRRPKRKSHFSVCHKAGLWGVKFSYSSEQFGAQLSLEKMRIDELEDPKETPEEIASKFISSVFESPQSVLKGARHMAAVEISCEPSVRKYVRSNFKEHAVLSTSPTPDGSVAIDSLHQYAGVKWMKDKPLNKFEDAQWLLIQKAEEEKVLNVTIKLPEKHLNKLINDFNEYYLSDGVSKSAQLWNEQRKMILKDALFEFLLPLMEKEARITLTLRAKNWLLAEYGKALWDKVCVGPYKCKENVIGSDDEAAPRVMACCWGPGKPPTTFVMLDSSGEVLDVLYAGSLSLRSQNVTDLQRKKNDQDRVLKFMREHQPHVVVVGAINLSCTRLKDDIYEIIFKMVEENPREVGHEMDGLSVVFGDESWSRLYESSRISSEQLQGQSGIVKRAVALGRYLQNPLALIGALCGPGREVLSCKLINLEKFMTPDEKYGMVEQIMVDITNQVGLDINLAISHEWLFSTLQFISGLGPRKAAALQRSLVRTGSIYNRRDLVIIHGLGKKVFLNAVGFLRVRRSGLAASSSQCFDILDDTRIHPESYAIALELANDIFDEDAKSNGNRESDPELTLDYVRGRPNLLKTLDVDEYSKSKKRENKKETLYDIIRELVLGFQDRRKQYEEPSQEEEFFMISGETDETMAEGLIVEATVRRVQDEKAICALESGLTGILMKEDYFDGGELFELSEKLHEGDILSCKIKSVQKNRYQVFLVCTEREMKSKRHQNPPNLDPYYHEDQSSLLKVKEKTLEEKALTKRQFKPRMIVHPHFRNVTADEAMVLLSDKGLGECIIRPSSRGPSYLTLTLKVYDGVYAHKDIIEGGKEHKDIASLLRIGKTLKIGEDTFEDLDEVVDRYVDPLVGHLKEMLNYRKFQKGTKAEVDEILRIEKMEYPMRIVYCFGISHEHPGTFILTFIRSSKPHHEYIGLHPKGFKFRKKMFGDMDRLVAYFQRHINDPRQDSGPSIRSAAAMVPMQSPATGKFSADKSGWGHQSFDRDHSSAPASGTGRGRGRGRGDRGRGRGRGRGPGSYNEDKGNTTDSEAFGSAAPSWDSVVKDGDNGWSKFPGAQVQNSPGREAFPGGWGSGGSGSGGTSGNDGGGWSSGGNGWGRVNTGGDCDRESGGSGWGAASGGDSDFGGVRGGGNNNSLGGSDWGKGNGGGSNGGSSWGSGGSGWVDGRDNSRQDFGGSGWSGGRSDSGGASRSGRGRARGNDFGSRGCSGRGRDFGEAHRSGCDSGWGKASSGDNGGWGKASGDGNDDQVSRGSDLGRSSGGDDSGQMCGGGGWGGASGSKSGWGGGGSSDNGSGWGKPSDGSGRGHGGSGWGTASNDDAGRQGSSGSGWDRGGRTGGGSSDNGSGWGKPSGSGRGLGGSGCVGASDGDAGGQGSSGNGWGKASGGSSWSGADSSHNGRVWGKPSVGSGLGGASEGDAGGQGSGGSDWGKASGSGSGWGRASGNDGGTGGQDSGGNGGNRGRVDNGGGDSGGNSWGAGSKGSDGQGSSGWGGASGGWGEKKYSNPSKASGSGSGWFKPSGAEGSGGCGWGGATCNDGGTDGQDSGGNGGNTGRVDNGGGGSGGNGWGGASKGSDGQGSRSWGGASGGGGSGGWGEKKDSNPSKAGSGWSGGGR